MTTESTNRDKHRIALLIGQIGTYAALIDLHTDMCVFIRHAAHVGLLEVDVCYKKSNFTDKATRDSLYYEPGKHSKDAEQIINELTNIKMNLKRFLVENKVSLDGLEYSVREEYDYRLAGGWKP